MNKRIWGVIIIMIGLLLIAGVIYMLFFYQPLSPGPAVSEPLAGGPQSSLPAVKAPERSVAVQPVSPLKKTEVKQADLARMAVAFAERFGSFSNQSDYGNIRDLQIFMTAKMKNWSQNYISESPASKNNASIYYGMVTKSILSEVKQFDSEAGQAEILVKTQRRELNGASGNSTTYYQDITIKYLREGGVWLVDAAEWQAR